MNNPVGQLLPFVLIALVFYFLILRPQRRRQQTVAQTQATIAPGAEVMLTSGIFGRVASLDDETVQLEISPGTHIKVSRQAVVRVVEELEPGPDLADPDDEPPTADRHP